MMSVNPRQSGTDLYNAQAIVAGFLRLYAIVFLLLFVMSVAGYIFNELFPDPRFGSTLAMNGFASDRLSIQYFLRNIVGGDGLIQISASAVAFFNANRISRFLVRWPTKAFCPKCRFSLENFRADRCPECGLFLGPDFHAPPPASEPPAGQG